MHKNNNNNYTQNDYSFTKSTISASHNEPILANLEASMFGASQLRSNWQVFSSTDGTTQIDMTGRTHPA